MSFDSGSEAGSSFSLADHFATPRISGLFTDLAPEEGGIVSLKESEDRIAVSFEDVPEAETGNLNSFQIEVFFNGDIGLTHLGTETLNAIVGLSDGEAFYYPSDFTESDLSEANTPSLKADPGFAFRPPQTRP